MKFLCEINNEVKCSQCENLNDQFLTIDVEPQIKNILREARMTVLKNNINNFNNENVIYRSLDGNIYKKKLENLGDDKILISLNLNTDGAPIVKSHNFSFWPICATITELKPSQRDKFENLIILGLWQSDK
ncbi:unnamed protein product [Brachionus calyciflorus]|uniref:Uncharacterized protein n=1 Tax=Brachionus calyciflorus TaxID=104777 RepID=A0A814FNP3_9BILA|nr:unnamed protein product [Brachionus calyciflorus]